MKVTYTIQERPTKGVSNPNTTTTKKRQTKGNSKPQRQRKHNSEWEDIWQGVGIHKFQVKQRKEVEESSQLIKAQKNPNDPKP